MKERSVLFNYKKDSELQRKKDNVRKNLKLLRTMYGLNGSEFSNLLGVNTSTLRGAESEGRISDETSSIIAKNLGLSNAAILYTEPRSFLKELEVTEKEFLDVLIENLI